MPGYVTISWRYAWIYVATLRPQKPYVMFAQCIRWTLWRFILGEIGSTSCITVSMSARAVDGPDWSCFRLSICASMPFAVILRPSISSLSFGVVNYMCILWSALLQFVEISDVLLKNKMHMWTNLVIKIAKLTVSKCFSVSPHIRSYSIWNTRVLLHWIYFMITVQFYDIYWMKCQLTSCNCLIGTAVLPVASKSIFLLHRAL